MRDLLGVVRVDDGSFVGGIVLEDVHPVLIVPNVKRKERWIGRTEMREGNVDDGLRQCELQFDGVTGTRSELMEEGSTGVTVQGTSVPWIG
jgi:hypothetical protein